MSKVLVTGGAGFIGSNLTEALLKKGHWVRVLDIRKGKQILNYEPTIGIEAGLKKTVEYFKDQQTCLR